MTILLAGLSRRVITPPPGIFLMGYGSRVQGNIGAHDALYATTVVFTDGSASAALLTVDHTFINARIVAQLKARIHSACGIAPEAVFVCCSHTHAGPVGYADEESRPEDRAYIDLLVNRLLESVVEAQDQARPVTLRGGWDEARININRREQTPEGVIIGQNPGGPVDHSVQALQLVDESGQLLATLVNYACHPVVMGPLNRLASADWVGAMRATIETSQPGYCLFVQGATADVNPRKMRWTVDSWDEVEEQGQAVGEAALRACEKAGPLAAGPVRAQQNTYWLKLLPAKGYNAQIRAFLPDAQTDDEIRAAIQHEFPWHTALETRTDGTYAAMNAGTLKIGAWALAALETEPFTETGLAVKAASPARMTFFAGYTNGCNSYLPVRSAYDTGGYEVETAPLFYGLPAGFVPGSAEFLRDQLIAMLRT